MPKSAIRNPEWIRVFNMKALHGALLDVPDYHPPGEKTVDRWSRNESRMDPQDIAAIRTLIGAQKDRPAWVDGAIEDVVGRVVSALADEQRAAARLAARTLLPPPDAETPEDPGEDAPERTRPRNTHGQ